MNYLTLENKFKQLDQREKDLRSYFSPSLSNKNKHHYINDIRADFQYDNLLYGMGLYISLEDDPTTNPIKLPAATPRPRAEAKSQSPKLSKISTIARRKQPEALQVKETVPKDNYVGIFAHTKIIKSEYLGLRSKPKSPPLAWKSDTDEQKAKISNQAATEEIRYMTLKNPLNEKLIEERFKMSYVDESPQRYAKINTLLEKQVVRLNSEDRIRDLSLTLPEPPSYLLTDTQFEDESVSFKAAMINQADHEWETFRQGKHYETSPKEPKSPITAGANLQSPLEFRPGCFLLQLKLTNSQQICNFDDFTAVFTDLTDPRYPQHTLIGLRVDAEGFVLFGSSSNYSPLKHFDLADEKDLVSHTLRAQLIGHGITSEDLIDKYVHFGPHTEAREVKVMLEIQAFEAFQARSTGTTHFLSVQKREADEHEVFASSRRSDFRYLKEKPKSKQPELHRLERLPSIHRERPLDQMTTKLATPQFMQIGSSPRPRDQSALRDGGRAISKLDTRWSTNKSQSPSKNPMTGALYKFREDSSAFRPSNYSANLQIFHECEQLELKYPRIHKPKEPQGNPQITFLLSGQPVMYTSRS